jgi:O-antigen ligase
LSSRLSEKDTAEGSGRVNEWRAAYKGFREHPVRGLGLGGFFVESNDLLRSTPGVNLRTFRLEKAGQRVHNAYIDTAAELGLIGLFFFGGMLISTFLALLRVRRRWAGRPRNFRADTAAALVVSLIGFAVASIFLSTNLSFALFMIVGVAIALEEPWGVPANA